jgi:nicotinate-nucleotide adenylyltransferase
MQRIGVLGGTFDPIHYGHLAIAEEARWLLGLQQVYLIPAAQQPLKPGQHRASPQQRMAMVRMACAGNALLLPSDIELGRAPPSYTVDTLRDLRATLAPDTELWFILGSDSLASLPRWHAPHEMLGLVRFAALVRPGSLLDLEALDAELPGIAARTRLIEGPRLDISSTDLRQRCAEQRPIRYQVPESVRQYIQEQRLYEHE